MSAKKRSAKGQFVAARGKKRATKVERVELPAPRKRRKRRRSNPEATGSSLVANPSDNPPPIQDLVEFILPGFAGYGATKMLSRIVLTQLSKRYPNAGKHLAAGSTVVSFLAAWFLLHRIKRLAKYHTPAVVGAGIASLQTIVSTYLPKYGWMVSDVQPEAAKLGASPLSVNSPGSPSPVETLFPGGPEVVDDDDDGSLSDIDLGSLAGGEDHEYANAN